MAKRNITIFAMLFIAGTIAMCWGLAITRRIHGSILDFRMNYFAARCVVQGCDPYSEAQMTHLYLAEGGERVATAKDGNSPHYLVAFQIYPPTAELLFGPFALLPWPTAYAIWISLTLGLMSTAAFLMWDVARIHAPDPPFYLAWLLLVNSGGLFAGGNPAGVAVSLGVIGIWCILEGRYTSVGILCMAISLAIKPHDAGLIWLFLLFLGAAYIRRAVQSMLLLGLMAITAGIWVWHVSPHWIEELHSNMAILGGNGSAADPAGTAGTSMLNLQAVLAVFRNDSGFYNSASILICALLLSVLLFVTLRHRHSQKSIWLGLAAITVLSLLPVYHRSHDGKILLLTLPACAILWTEEGPVSWLALLFTGGGILATSELALILLQTLPVPQIHGIRGEALSALTTRPAPLVLLAEGIFYLWVYVWHCKQERVNHSNILSIAENESVAANAGPKW